MAKGKAMTDDELCTLIDHKIGQSVGAGKTADFVTADRLKALKYYKGEPLGDEVDGKSKVVSRDVAEAIDAMMPSLLKIFSSGDEVAHFNATKPQDEAEAAQRTDYANWVWSQQNEGYLNFHTWFKDALLEKLGTIKIWWEESTDESREEYEGLTDDEFEALLEDQDLELQEHTETPDPAPQANQAVNPQVPQIPQMPQLPAPGAAQPPNGQNSQNSPNPGQPQPPQASGGPMQAIARALGLIPQPKPPMLHDAVFRRMHDESRVRVAPVPPEETLINRQSGADELPWGNRRRVTIADLIEEFPKKEDLIRSLPDEDSLHSAERTERFVEEGSGNRDGAAIDDETRMVWVVDAYFRVDFDGDGYAEFRKVTTAGHDPGSVGGILENCEYDSSPYACLTPIPMPHKLIGMSIADQTVDIQEIKTTLIRQGLNNVYLQHGSEVFVTGEVDYEALLNRRPGNVIRGKPGSSVTPFVVEPMLADIQATIAYFDSVRDQRTGSSRTAPGPGADALDNAYTQTAAGAAMVQTEGQERIACIARTFAETGVKAAFRRIDELVCKHSTKSAMLKLRGQWTEFNPGDWKAKVDCSVTVGLGTDNKTVQVGQLTSLLTQVVAPIVQMQAGLNGPIVTAPSLHFILEKLVQAMGFKTADQMFPDPTANPAPKAPPQPNPDMIKAQASIHTTQMKAQADGQKTAATLASQERIAQLKIDSEERIAQLTGAVDRELGYAKIGVDNKAIDTEVELKKRQHETDTAFKVHGAQLDAREADREDRSADVQNAKAQHDAEHDTASLTQAGSLAREKQKSDASTSDRDFQAKNPNFSPPNPRKLIKVGLTHDAGGMVSAAKRHFDDGTIEDVPIARTQGNA